MPAGTCRIPSALSHRQNPFRWELLSMEIPATLSPHHSYQLTLMFKICLPCSPWYLHADLSNSFIPDGRCFNLDYIRAFISNICRLYIQKPLPAGRNFFKHRVVINNISKHECVLCPALSFSPDSHCRDLLTFSKWALLIRAPMLADGSEGMPTFHILVASTNFSKNSL